MAYDFLAHFAITDKASLEKIRQKKRPFEVMSFLARCEVLSTALADENLAKEVKQGLYQMLLGDNASLSKGPIWESFQTLLLPPPEVAILALPQFSMVLKIGLELQSPFFSRDDHLFYPHDNPVRKEWVFGVPYLSAAAVKGLLHWAYRCCLDDPHLEEAIFGTANEDEADGIQGSLYTYPLFWEGQLGLSVINPHDRKSGAGTKPITYEVVTRSSRGNLLIILANRKEDKAFLKRAGTALAKAVAYLMGEGHLSAKRSADWGRALVINIGLWVKGLQEKEDRGSEAEVWQEVVDKDGNLKPSNDPCFTTSLLARLSGLSKSQVKKDRQKAYQKLRERWETLKAGPKGPAVLQKTFRGLEELQAFLEGC